MDNHMYIHIYTTAWRYTPTLTAAVHKVRDDARGPGVEGGGLV